MYEIAELKSQGNFFRRLAEKCECCVFFSFLDEFAQKLGVHFDSEVPAMLDT